MQPNEVFFSHASQDRAVADGIARAVIAHGVPVWYSPVNVVGSQKWHDEIGAALARCDWFVLLLSPDAVQSMWVKRELLFALEHARYDEHIVPLLHLPCDHAALSWTLSQFQMVDFTGDVQDGCRDLLRIWGIGLRPDRLP
jgi:hypothetical protein